MVMAETHFYSKGAFWKFGTFAMIEIVSHFPFVSFPRFGSNAGSMKPSPIPSTRWRLPTGGLSTGFPMRGSVKVSSFSGWVWTEVFS